MQVGANESVNVMRLRCGVCFEAVLSVNTGVQLECRHVLCTLCLQETACGANVYQCPFDWTQGGATWVDQSVLEAINAVLANPQHSFDSSWVQYLIANLRTRVNYTRVICRNYLPPNYCLNLPVCPYDHTDLSIRSVPCPLGQSCRRGQMCPYAHQTYSYSLMQTSAAVNRPAPAPATPSWPATVFATPPVMLTGQFPVAQSPPGYWAGSSLYSHPEATLMPPGPLRPPSFTYHHLPKWYNSQPPAGATLVQLSPTSKGYREVAQLFLYTSGMKTIVKIERIQNKRLYTSFAYKHESMSIIEGRKIDLMKLFHGTRTHAPQAVYESDTGLDQRLCTHGGWGIGSYFARNSFYSVKHYGHRLPDGSEQILCCLVITGVSFDCGTTFHKTLRHPPQRPSSSLLYHSVKASEGQSDIYVVYELNMSYPYYLVTYR